MRRVKTLITTAGCIAALSFAAPVSADQGKARGRSAAKQAQHGADKNKQKDKRKAKGAKNDDVNTGSGMRFQGLDRDGDGVITRGEWRGSEIAFRNQDWNGDGVLRGDEVRPGARRPRR